MAKTSPTLIETEPAEPVIYRPLSGFAVTSLVFAGLYALLVVLSAVVALIKGEPFYLPTWLLGLPIAGIILSLLAYRQIRNSEDTRAGTTLAKWGLWLSALCGLGYLTYSIFTGLAVQAQANRFLVEKGADAGFFPLLTSGNDHDVLAAFLLTQTVTERRGFKPSERSKLEVRFDQPVSKDVFRGKLSLFLDAPLVRLLRQSQEPPIIETLGLKSWDYEGRGYKIERNYRVSTVEGGYDVLLTVQSADGEAGEARKWFIAWRSDCITAIKLTPLGKQRQELRRQAFYFGKLWLEKLARGAALDAYLDTRDPGERKALREQVDAGSKYSAAAMAASGWSFAVQAQTTAIGGPVPVLGLPHGLPRDKEESALLLLPDFLSFLRGTSILKVDDLRAPETKLAAFARLVLPALFANPQPNLQLRQDTVDYSPMVVSQPGRLTIQLDFEMPLPATKTPSGPVNLQVVGKLVVSAPEDADPAQPDVLRHFRVSHLECERVLALAQSSGKD
jgi:hypothetical protein